MKKLLKILFSRVVIVGLSLVLQLAALITVIAIFDEYFIYFFAVCSILSVCAVLWIINNKSNPAYKIAWLIPILIFPIFGVLFYILFGRSKLSKREKLKMSQITKKMKAAMEEQPSHWHVLQQTDPIAAKQSYYIQAYAYSFVYQDTNTVFLSPGEVKFTHLLEELQKAKHFIFMEYFIIQEGKMWNAILEILEQKASEGVDVRVLYDDVGCLFTLPYRYFDKLRKKGIQCFAFNPFIPILSSRINNRDHRKITVIDGYVGFTGGINLADEYINAFEKHGHWKDSAVMLQGPAVWNLTTMFLSLWEFVAKSNEDYTSYLPVNYQTEVFSGHGFVQPFADSPLDDEAVGETVYLNMINHAQKYVYIHTPYLILDSEMTTSLCNCAKSGLDVRIVTPHIPDKWYVHMVTRANYEPLLESGVKIYEYTPGFIHAKTFVCDDQYAVVGTINLDYRSLYLHFECGVWMYQADCIPQMKKDYLDTLEICKPISLADCKQVNRFVKLVRSILRVFAPLM